MGGFARDVARRFALSGQTYSHIAHMEALLRADRFFGVSLLSLQQTEASCLAAFILACSAAITFELFTHEWLRNPARVAAAQEARRLACIAGGRASVLASNTRAEALDVQSSVTGRPDGMGMNIAGSAQKVQQAAADLDISADDLVGAQRGNAGFFGGRATAGRTVAIAQAASSLASRDVFNSNLGHQARNKDVLRLGEEIGSAVMGPEQWKLYITTSHTQMAQSHKPWIRNKTEALATKRFPGEREGWGLHRVGRTTPGGQ